MTIGNVESLERWYKKAVRPFLTANSPNRVPALDEGLARIRALDWSVNSELAICFLGTSGVGKSTLINALVAGKELILPSGGIGPLTALAMEVRYRDLPSFEAEYHTARSLWQGIGFPLERGYAAALKEATSRNPDSAVPADFVADVNELADAPDSHQIDDLEVQKRLDGFRKQAQLLVKGNQDSDASLPYLVDSLRDAAG